MRKINSWLLMPFLAISTIFITSTLGGVANNAQQEKVLTLDTTPANQLSAMEAYHARKAIASKLASRKSAFSEPQISQREHHARQVKMAPFKWGLPVATGLRQSLFKSTVTDPITVTVNGGTSESLAAGDSLVIVITFSDSLTEAEASFWIDMDGNGALDDTIDVDDGDGGLAFDNSFEDEDMTPGVFQITLWPGEEDGLLSVTNLKILLHVQDALASDTVTVDILETMTDNSVSGTVTPAQGNIVVFAFPSYGMGPMDGTAAGNEDDGGGMPPHMTVTDVSGAYTLYFDNPDTVDVMAFDFLGAYDAPMVTDTSYKEISAVLQPTNIDFNFTPPTTYIAGSVNRFGGGGQEGIEVFAFGNGPEYFASTDENGNYSIGVLPGHYYVEIGDDIIPEFMASQSGDQMAMVNDGEIATVDFTIYPASSTISGTVTIDGVPLGIEIEAGGRPEGADSTTHMWTYTMSDPMTGGYVLNVSPEVDFNGYFLWPRHWPQGSYLETQPWNVPEGASGVDIAFVTSAGSISGVVTVAGTSDILYQVHIQIWNDNFYTDAGPDPETGIYNAPVPPGNYYVEAFAEGFFPYKSATMVEVSTGNVEHNIALEEVAIAGHLEGNVTDAISNFNLPGAEVWVWNQMLDYGDFTIADSVGHYRLDLPAGDYEIGVHVPGYQEGYGMATISTGGFTLDFMLEKFTFLPPQILSIMDKPGDQGGWALIHFEGGFSDRGPFFGWSIWAVPGPEYQQEDMINVGFFLAEPRPGGYTVLVPTFVDSNAANTEQPESYKSWFVVTGFGDGDNEDGGGGMFFADSEPTSGWSVDNIAPGVPAGLSVNGTENGISVAWEPSTEEDFQFFVVNYGDITTTTSMNVAVSGPSLDLTSSEVVAGNTYGVTVAAVDHNGNYSVFTDVIETVAGHVLALGGELATPASYALLANYPNPFNPSTTLRFELPSSDKVSLVVYDLAGREITSLLSGQMNAGYHQVVWNGRDRAGNGVATGVYFYRIITGSGFAATRKMVFMK